MNETPRTYTHPDVLTSGIRDGWADPTTDPARIDWAPRQAAALIPFAVVDGRPVNPCEKTGIRYGRNELGHWGEQVCADAIVTATDEHGHRWLLMVERGDGHGWALPGGTVDPGEDPADAAARELGEETGLHWGDGRSFRPLPARYVPDPRASDEAWMVTVPARCDLGTVARVNLPAVQGADDAKRAAWVRADSYPTLTGYLATMYGGRVFAAHTGLLREVLTAATHTTPEVVVISFGYGHAAPPRADHTLDVRNALRNPHHDPAMRYRTGLDEIVREHVLTTPGAADVLRHLTVLAVKLLPQTPTGQPVRIAIGCVGGRHRSVALAEALATALDHLDINVAAEHRDITKPLLPKGVHR
ncbi:NUDIX domain-containing protein [Planomonospora sp. ID82291]|uniref:RapZ C-terminal domain-containing protein n=1 Tax=Planomonospora sp. ID82291 TaxID=2738136 RepID=UPI0018C3806D|nr:RNase adapter RapZ [Planomonospora sp. ID82291]MBG0814169.1 NUDIX domain-containing protein [Planomonospora sp. ID82291]